MSQLLTNQQIRDLFKAKAFMTEHAGEPEFKIPQQQLIGLAYLKKLRDEVVNNDKTLIIAGDGKHRSGKSVTAVTLALLWDRTFDYYFQHRICHTPRAFMNALNLIRKENIHGAVIIIDEAGASVGSDAFANKWMHAIQKAVMIIGWCNPIIIFLSPQSSFVDSKLRKMTHLYFKFARYSKNETTILPYEIHWNAIKQKFFYKKPKVNFMGQDIIIKKLIIQKPPQEIIDRYEELEGVRKSGMLEDFKKDVVKDEIEERKESVDINEVINYVVANHKIFEGKNSKPHKIVLDESIIKYTFNNLKSRQDHYVKITAERKLYEKQNEIKQDMEGKRVEEK